MQLEEKDWREETFNPLELTLDPENARFELYEGISQDAIRKHLVLKEDVISLAARIAETGGLLPGERIIVTKENNKYIVLEGNRRVCACQILLKKNLIHDGDLTSQIPNISDRLADKLMNLKAEVSATRDIGDSVVANLHAVSLRKPWSSLAIMRYAYKKLQSGKTIYDVSEVLKLLPEETNRLIVGYRIAHFCMNIPQWSDDERRTLFSEDVDFEPLLHVVRSPAAENHFGTPLFYDHGEPNLIDHLDLESKIHKICLHALFSQFKQQEHRVTKHTSISDYLKKVFPSYSDTDKQESFFNNTPPTDDRITQKYENEKSKDNGTAAFLKTQSHSTNYRHRTQVFCENIVCSRHEDDRLKQLTKEIRRVSRNLKDFPLSGSMLLRALFEWSLTYHLKRVGKWESLKKKHPGKNGPTPTQLLKYCSNEHFCVFTEHKHIKRLRQILDDD